MPDSSIFFIAVIIALVLGGLLGAILAFSLKKKTLSDYENGLVKEIHVLPAVRHAIEPSVYAVEHTHDKDGGANTYLIKKCTEIKDGKPKYENDLVEINFMQKFTGGIVIEGIQEEQLVIMLMDRIRKQRAQNPIPEQITMLDLLDSYLVQCRRAEANKVS